MGYIIGIIIWALIWGFITKSISASKGYDGGFWWGFWLGFIGLIVVACKPDNRSYNQSSNYNSSYSTGLSQCVQEKENNRVLEEGGWKCVNCSRANPSYVTTCQCGVSKSNNVPIERPKPMPLPETAAKETSPADEILKLKQLLDAGLLTQDEFDTKKKQLLGL